MDRQREKEHKEFIKKYGGQDIRTMGINIMLDNMEVLRKTGIIQAVKKYGDNAIIAFQNRDNKIWEKENE